MAWVKHAKQCSLRGISLGVLHSSWGYSYVMILRMNSAYPECLLRAEAKRKEVHSIIFINDIFAIYQSHARGFNPLHRPNHWMKYFSCWSWYNFCSISVIYKPFGKCFTHWEFWVYILLCGTFGLRWGARLPLKRSDWNTIIKFIYRLFGAFRRETSRVRLDIIIPGVYIQFDPGFWHLW